MTRWLVLLAAGVAFAYAADAGAQPRAQRAQQEEQTPPKAPALFDIPLQLYLAKGAPNACGEGCSEWIAVEGDFDPKAAGRVQAFLNRHGARKLPIFIQSPGGNTTAARSR